MLKLMSTTGSEKIHKKSPTWRRVFLSPMSKSTKRKIILGASLLVAGFVMLNVLAHNHASAMMHFTSCGVRTNKPEGLSGWAKLRVLVLGVNVPRPAGRVSPSALAPDCQVLTVTGPDGVNLSCWYCDRGSGGPLVILFHGYSAEKTSLIPEAKAFLELGASVLLVDFRGSGGSSEAYTTIGVREADDVAAVVRYAQRHLAHSGIILFGQSMGAAAILRAVDRSGITPDGVIAEAVFDTMLNTVRNRFAAMHLPSLPSAHLLVFWGGWQWGFNGFEHNPVHYARAVQCPALFMHGTDDPRATVDEGRRVCDAVHGSKEFKTFHRTGHESYLSTHAKEWRTVVGAFMRKTANNPIHPVAMKPDPG
jgi:pimeloyl-ACP methyl ester carboxylesterase